MATPKNADKTTKTLKAAKAPEIAAPEVTDAAHDETDAVLDETSDFDSVDVTAETLDATPARLLEFLRGVGTRPEIQLALSAFGYDDDEHQLGWTLLHGCSGFLPPTPGAPAIDRRVTEAIATLDARDERTHALVDASLKHRAPTARTALLHDIAPGRGAESVVYFHALLQRLELLHAGTLPDVSAADAKAALAVLEKRGLTKAWRDEHRALVTQAQRLTGVVANPAAAVRREKMVQQLKAARAFYEEWSRIARTELKRKDYLIALGLASRKSPAAKTPANPAEPKPPTG